MGAVTQSPPNAEVKAKPAVVAAPKTTRKLCGGALSSKGSEISVDAISQRVAPGERELSEHPSFKTAFTWVNFWAAWCVPCKEEIPLLLEWEKRLVKEGVDFKLIFVSLDDDERQLRTFLEQQPANGLRRTYWLREGRERTEWLAKVGLSDGMELPAHLLADSSGKARCKVQGAIESSDYSQLLGLVHGSQ
jgi:thiol-disulfide isomerase/thioredoxin